jgi:putative flippase GtrA
VNLKKLTEIKFLRFLLTGGLNTAVTYTLYLILLNFFAYTTSYSISYVCGILLAFLLSRYVVFKEHQGLKSVIFFPLIYLAQYLFGLLVVWFWVRILFLPEFLAPLAAIILSLPLTYTLSKLVFIKPKHSEPKV